MTILTQIRDRNLSERKTKGNLAGLTTTLIGEIVMHAKNDGNRSTADSDSILVLKRFQKNLIESISLYMQAGRDTAQTQEELAYVESLLPTAASQDDMRAVIAATIGDQTKSIKLMGPVMAALKAKFGDALDAKVASALAKEMLN